MKLNDVVLNLILACISGYFAVLLTATVQERRWVTTAFLGFVVLCAGLVTHFISDLHPGELPINLSIVAVASGAILVIFAIVLFRRDRNSTRLKSLFSYLRRGPLENAPSKGWSWDKDTIESSDALGKFGDLPPLLLLDYDPAMLSELEGSRSLSSQISIYHIVEQKDYVSFVDAVYWAYLRRLSGFGIRITICILEKPSVSGVFSKYVRAIGGEAITIDRSVSSRFKDCTPAASTLPAQTSIPAGITVGPRSSNLPDGYEFLVSSALFLPLLFNSRHTLILLWEGYYSRIKAELGALTDHIEIDFKRGKRFSLALDGYRTGYLILPTLKETSSSGHTTDINPATSFCLGLDTLDRTQDRISTLDDTLLDCLLFEILAPLLRFHERMLFVTLCFILLMLRKQVSTSFRPKITAALAWVVHVARNSIHDRLTKSEGSS